MSSEPDVQGAPPGPGFWRLGWLLFLQPLAFGDLFRKWDLEDPGLYGLIKRSLAGNVVARLSLASAALWLLVLAPAASVLLAGAARLLVSAVQWRGVAGAVAMGLAGGVAVSLYSVRTGVRSGGAFAIAFGFAMGLFGDPSGATLSIAIWIKLAIGLLAIIAVAAFALAFDKTASQSMWSLLEHAAASISIGLIYVIGFTFLSSLIYFSSSIAGATLAGVPLGIAVGVVLGVGLGMTSVEADLILGIPLGIVAGIALGYPIGIAIGVTILSWYFFPVPGLAAFLGKLVKDDRELAKALLKEAFSSFGSVVDAAMDVIVDLIAKDLERAARENALSRVATMEMKSLQDFELVLGQRAASYGSALAVFQMAARDLVAGGASYRRRREAIKRARAKVKNLLDELTAKPQSDPLQKRLRVTARLWVDTLDEADAKLGLEEAESPEVPTVFVAGSPLKPGSMEERELFKGRDDLVKLIEHDLAPDRRGVLLVFGQRRMGKTSLANWLPVFLGETTVIPVDFRLLSGDSHRETPFRRVLEAIRGAVFDAAPPPDVARWGEGLRWLEELDGALENRRLLVVIDEVERVEDGIREGWCNTDFLDFIRAAGDALRHIRFLLLTAYPLHRLGPHWVDRLVSATSRTVSYLDEASARELVVCPVPDFPDIYPDGGVERILHETGRHPYLIQKVCDELCRLLNERGGPRRATDAELTKVFDLVIAQADLFDELWRQRTEEERSALRRLSGAGEPLELEPVARQLAREGYLVKRGDKVEIAVPLFRDWIAEAQGSASDA